jgi:hypothetical protein
LCTPLFHRSRLLPLFAQKLASQVDGQSILDLQESEAESFRCNTKNLLRKSKASRWGDLFENF